LAVFPKTRIPHPQALSYGRRKIGRSRAEKAEVASEGTDALYRAAAPAAVRVESQAVRTNRRNFVIDIAEVKYVFVRGASKRLFLLQLCSFLQHRSIIQMDSPWFVTATSMA